MKKKEQYIYKTQAINFKHIDTPIIYCEYDPADYTNEMYEKLGIELPNQLSNAIVKRKAEYLAGRYCAKQALKHAGCPASMIDIKPNKPPIWPKGFSGSISHTSYSAVAIAHQSPHISIGIDIENMISEKTINRIKRRIVNKDEEELIEKLGPHHATFNISLIFSIKESFYKAVNLLTKNRLSFKSISITSIDHQHNRATYSTNESLTEILHAGRSLEANFMQPNADQLTSLVIIQKNDI